MRNLILFISILILCLFFFEFSAGIVLGKKDASYYYINDSHHGYWYKSNIPAKDLEVKDIDLYTNDFGMVDKPRTIQKKPGVYRVALLGDSYMESCRILRSERMSNLIETYAKGHVEVFNFAMTSLGTVQELAIYRNRVRQFHPDLVICAFLTFNDIRNNHYELELASGYLALQYASRACIDSKGKVQFLEPLQPSAKRKFKWTISQFLPYSYLALARIQMGINDWHSHGIQPIKQSPSGLFGLPFSGPAINWGVYSPPEKDSKWDEAWRITERAIETFKQEVEKDGAQFLLLILSDAIQLFDNPRLIVKDREGILPPNNFDPFYPPNRLSDFCQKNTIRYINLADIFKKYKNLQQLKFPYFSFLDDDHWDKLGHKLAADTVYSHIKEYFKENENFP